jgi:hypothetical protein
MHIKLEGKKRFSPLCLQAQTFIVPVRYRFITELHRKYVYKQWNCWYRVIFSTPETQMNVTEILWTFISVVYHRFSESITQWRCVISKSLHYVNFRRLKIKHLLLISGS